MKNEDARDRVNLRIPGPTPCPPEILEAVSRQMINYRGPEMKALMDGLYRKLAAYLETSHEILFLTTSGTGGLEAVVANVVSPGDRVVGVSAGSFGERFCAIAETYGCDVKRLLVDWGKAASPDELRKLLRSRKNVAAVLLTQNETSTGIAHPVEALVRAVREESNALVLVDAISSLGAMPLPMESTGIDVVVTGSQKAWGIPPGMAMIFLGPRAVAALEGSRMPRFSFDLRRYRKAKDKGNFPFTPAISLVFALDASLDLMLRETASGVHARHARVAEVARSEARRLGLELFADPGFLSPTVTALRLPRGVEDTVLLELLRTKYRVVLARGQEKLQGQIVRAGHLGFVEEPEVRAAMEALGRALAETGASV
jgi:aspartate aminotransferase-like enzyme